MDRTESGYSVTASPRTGLRREDGRFISNERGSGTHDYNSLMHSVQHRAPGVSA
jgi:hypothetical protein